MMRQVTRILLAAVVVVGWIGTSVQAADGANTGTVIRTKKIQSTVVAGGTVQLDVYITNVTSLAAYQLEFTATDSKGVAATVTKMDVDTDRKGFVFAGRSIIDPMMIRGIRLGVVMWEGVVDVAASEEAYLATITIAVPANASGQLRVNAIPVTTSTVLTDRSAQKIAYKLGADAEIEILQARQIRTESRIKKRG